MTERIAILATMSSNLYRTYAEGLIAGFKRHGVKVSLTNLADTPSEDIVCAYGWRRVTRLHALGKKCLITERGFLGERTHTYWGYGWNGLNGRARYTEVHDDGARFRKLCPHGLTPWKKPRVERNALVMGQVRMDSAVAHINLPQFYKDAFAAMRSQGYRLKFRPHPLDPNHKVKEVPVTRATLAEDLNIADVVVTCNSNSGVDAVLAGVPTISMDEGSMAWRVSSHNLHQPEFRPDREAWAHALAWKQFNKEEVASGLMWDIVRHSMPKD